MTVLILPSWYPQNAKDLSGSFFREQAIALKKAGLKVIVANACFTDRKSLGQGINHRLRYEIDEGVDVFSYTTCSLGRARFPRLAKRIYLHNLKKVLKELKRKNLNFDIVHAHSFWCGGVGAWHIKQLLHKPFVITEHSSGFFLGEYNSYQKKWLQKIYQQTSNYICVSDLQKQVVSQKCGDNKKFCVIPNMVDNSFCNMGLPKYERFTYISIGNLRACKEHLFNIECFLDAFEGNSNVQLLIIGDGELRETIETYIHKRQAENKVKLLGALSRSDVCTQLNKCHIFSLVSSVEPFGVVYVEALRCGLPVIAAENAGGKDIVTNKNGYLIEIKNKAQLIDTYQKSYAEYSKFDVKRIIQDCIEHYSAQVVTNRIIEIYQETLTVSLS